MNFKGPQFKFEKVLNNLNQSYDSWDAEDLFIRAQLLKGDLEQLSTDRELDDDEEREFLDITEQLQYIMQLYKHKTGKELTLIK